MELFLAKAFKLFISLSNTMIMKYTRILFALIALFILATSSKSHAQNAGKPVAIDVLKARENLLKETTKLNKLKIKLADLKAEVVKQEQELQKANDRSSKTAAESNLLSTKASANAGDQKLTQKASRAAKEAYNDARNAKKITSKLHSNNKKLKSYESDIEKLRAKIEQMDQQLNFSENPNN